jgi:glycosyltransferase involved in cell wall biosynthesis
VEHAEWLGDLAPDRLYTAMAEAAVFAHPARYEPFGLAVLEAARAGCALVLGRIESLCELWHDAALFVPPGDDEALANAIRSLIASSDLRRQLAAAARARARRYTAGRMARRYIEWYRTARVAS